MMSILEYAQDVNKSIEEIYKLCDRLGIKYTDENTVCSVPERKHRRSPRSAGMSRDRRTRQTLPAPPGSPARHPGLPVRCG